MRGFALAVMLAGCGRLGFDVRNDAPAGDDAPGDGAAAELCNGIDDNGNGVIDEGCPCTGIDVTLPIDDTPVQAPIAWTGTGYLIAPIYGTAGVLQLIGIDGTSQGMVTIDATGTFYGLGPHAILWRGDRFLVVWRRTTDEVLVQALAADLTPLAPARVVATGFSPELVLSGGHVAIGWSTGAPKPQLEEIDLDGNAIGGVMDVGPTGFELDGLMPAADGYMIVETDEPTTTVTNAIDFAFDGTVTSMKSLSLAGEYSVGLTGGTAGYLASYINSVDYAVALDPTGAPLGPPIVLPAAEAGHDLAVFSVEGDGTHYVAEGLDDFSEIIDLGLDATANVISGPTAIGTVTTVGESPPQIVRVGGRHAMLLTLYGPSRYRIIEQCF